MTYYDTFDTEIQSEERAQVSPEEFDEVMQMMADDHDQPRDYEGYEEWSVEIEEKDYLGGYQNIITGPTYNGISI